MIGSIFNAFFYNPLYNGLVFLISIIPFADVGLAIIALTILVKLLLFPLSKKAVRTQLLMKELEPELNTLKEKYKNDKQQQARKVMDLYKEKGVNPFSGIALIFIQIPIIFALYWVFFRGGLPEVNESILYAFVSVPPTVNMIFIGLVDMSGKSLVLAALAGITQYFQIKITLPPLKSRNSNPTLKEDLARSFQLQMRYILPVFVLVFSYIISAAVALYWLTSNIFAIGQEIVVRKKLGKSKTP